MTILDSRRAWRAVGIVLGLLGSAAASATDWPQYRGPMTDGTTPDPILTTWPANGPAVAWRNGSISNGFSCLVVSQGRAFAMMSQGDGSGNYFEYCVAVDAATGTNIWATPVDSAPWDPTVNYNGGDGTPPYNTGDGPRATPAVKDGRVFALTGNLKLAALNVTNGAVLWSDDLPADYGGSIIPYENAASPCLDNDLLFVNLNTSTNNRNLAAFRTSDGSLAWSSQNERATHTTPVVATLQGVRQVIFATTTGLVSLQRDTGAFLWKFKYPFTAISVSMGSGPVVYSNLVYCTAGYNKGAAAARVTLSNGVWTATQLYYKNAASGQAYRSIWMTPVCYQGYLYTLCGENSTFLTTPLNCIELSTGNLKWSTNNFGMGGVVLVNSNLVVLTEKGDVVLAQCNPNAYTELARYTAFTFNATLPGKCWNNPTYADGRIYARSTREGVALDVSVVPPPVIAVQLSLHTLSLTFTTEFGPTYFVEYKSSLTAPSWNPLTNVAGTGTPFTIVDNGTNQASRFFRLRLQ